MTGDLEHPGEEDPLPAVPETPSARVAIVQAQPPGPTDRTGVLQEALVQARFREAVAAACKAHGVEPAGLRILIKIELSALHRGDPTGTDPRLVEHLVDLLHDGGYTEVVLGDTRDGFERRLENRGVLAAAELLGFDFVTPKGRPYDILDLSEDLVDVEWPAGSVLAGTQLSRAWMEAHLRILLGSCRTHPAAGYALCIDNLLRVLPLRDKDYHYRARLSPGDVVPDLLRVAPPGFCLLDAWTGSHGNGGAWAPRPIDTQTAIASTDALLVDHMGAVKMGLDPYVNPGVAAGLRQLGLPEPYEILGSLAPWPGWENVHPFLLQAMQDLERLPLGARVHAWASPVDEKLFPFKQPLDARLNGVLAGLHARADEAPLALGALTGLYGSIAAWDRIIEAWEVLGAKDRLPRREVPLGLDLERYSPADYDEVITYMEPLERLARETPPDEGGLRWRYLDGSVLFAYEAEVGAPFEDWTERVDVSRAVQFMNDYIGGNCVVVERDDRGRALRQGTRTIYLPQPNTMALSGGRHIDVCKLETARYEPDRHKVWWKTLRSPNDSATHDDGTVTFARTPEGRTRITIIARQQFRLPPFFELIEIDRYPQVKDRIVAWAYQQYFQQTIANFETRFEGREHRIGRPWDGSWGEVETEEADPLHKAREILDKATRELPPMPDLTELVRRALGGNARPEPVEVDAQGVAHFEPGAAPPKLTVRLGQQPAAARIGSGLKGLLGEAGSLLADLGRAVEKDLGLRRTR